MFEAKEYEQVVIDAAIKLNEIYYLFGENPDEKYDMFRRGFVMAISAVYGIEPISVAADIDNV